MDRSVWYASTFLWLYLRCSIPGVNAMRPNNSTHAIWAFQHIFLATMSSSRPVGVSLRIQDIALDSDIFLESSRQRKIGCCRIEFPASWNQHKGTLNDANQHAIISFRAMQQPGSESSHWEPVLQIRQPVTASSGGRLRPDFHAAHFNTAEL